MYEAGYYVTACIRLGTRLLRPPASKASGGKVHVHVGMDHSQHPTDDIRTSFSSWPLPFFPRHQPLQPSRERRLVDGLMSQCRCHPDWSEGGTAEGVDLGELGAMGKERCEYTCAYTCTCTSIYGNINGKLLINLQNVPQLPAS